MILAVLAACATPALAQQPTPQYIIEANIIAIPAAEGRECQVVSEGGTYTLLGNGGGMSAFGELKKLVCDDVTLTLRVDGNFGTLLWNGEENPPEDTVLELISAPRVATQAGKMAVISSGSALTYFTREEDGCFKLHVTTEEDSPVDSPGIRMAFTPQPADGDPESRLVDIDMELSLKALAGRETLQGCASLDVGKPILTLRTMASKVSLVLGQWHLVSGHQFTMASGEEGDFLLVLLRVQNVKDLPLPLPTAPAQ
jgi:hypothetical protein